MMRKLLLPILICLSSPVALPGVYAQNLNHPASRPRLVEKQTPDEPTPTTENRTVSKVKVVPQLTSQLVDEPADNVAVVFSNRKLIAQQLDALDLMFPFALSERLFVSLESKMGVPYRYNGTDDSGYDCSGLVWRAFQEAGLIFERSSARTYWDSFPAATEEETRMFGTLVFFNDLGHVGIVRDGNSFYHASRSQGVTLSSLTGYWGSRITGFRRIPFAMPVAQNARIEQPESGELIDATDPAETPPATDSSKGKKGKTQSDRKEFFRR
ncbi:MAG: C40 family peptidase [Blastocatellia bacterium]